MIRYVVLLHNSEAIGPFDTREEALAYVATDWQGSDMHVVELYAPADSAEDRAPDGESGQDRESYSDDQDRDSYYVPE